MRPHISLDVRDVAKSVAFYEKVFGMKPQKQVEEYAKLGLRGFEWVILWSDPA